MTLDPINNSDKLFPTYSGNNDNLLYLLNKTSKILCKWFSETESLGLLPVEGNFKCSVPDEYGNSAEVLFSEIESLLYSSFNPVHPGSLAHLDPPPLTISILGDLIEAGLNNNLLAYELSPSISLLEESVCNWFSKKLGYNKYYEHIPFIKEKLGIKPPVMSPELEDKLCNLFMEIQKPYAKHCPDDRVNFLNYYYVLYKL